MSAPNLTKTYFAAANANPASTIAASRIVRLVPGTGKVERTSDEDAHIPHGIAKSCESENGGAVGVAISGLNDVEFGAAVNPGAFVMTDADGKAITAVAPCYVVGRYMGTSATQAGQVAQILIAPFRLVEEA